jgi:hypothetical protein
MHDPYYEAESLDELEVGTPEYGEVDSFEASVELDAASKDAPRCWMHDQ